jgi:hypothetical protein
VHKSIARGGHPDLKKHLGATLKIHRAFIKRLRKL